MARFRALGGICTALSLACGTPAKAPDATGTQQSERVVVRAAAWGVSAPEISEGPYLDAQLRRAAGDAGLAEALGFSDERRVQALWSLARIGGESARHRLFDLLDEQGPSGSTPLAALALLQAPGPGATERAQWDALEDAVWRRYALAEDLDEAQSLLLVIARLGGDASVKRLGVDLARLPEAQASGLEVTRYEDAMTALGMLCARGFALDAPTRDAIALGLDKTHGQVQGAATYALGRCARASTELFALAQERKVIAARLEETLDGASDEQRRLAWIAFGALGETPGRVHDSILGVQAPAWWVEAEAVRALAQSPEGRAVVIERLTALDLSAFTGARVHVLLQLLAGLRGHAISEKKLEPVLRGLQAAVNKSYPAASPRRQRELGHVQCELGALLAIRRGSLDELRPCRALALPLDPTARLEVEALLAMTDAVMAKKVRVEALVARAQDLDSRVSTPALAALAELDDESVNAVLQSALERDDLGVVAAAAGAVASRSRDAGKRSLEVVPALRRVVTRLKNSDGAEARLAAIEALGVLARRPERGVKPGTEGTVPAQEAPWLESVIVPLAADPAVAIRRAGKAALRGRPELLLRYERPLPIAGRDAFGPELEAELTSMRETPAAGLRVKTELGEFVIDLRGARAPMNQSNLLGLARRGFFEGLRFHRVAAGFVVQGGDPRGDGYGGPGYLVPCEWSNLRYERGTVGIALAGKDTGGSQIFITQTPQPHLDARYTVVGHVTSGMDVVDRILPGDGIETVEALDVAALNAAVAATSAQASVPAP